MPFPFRFMLISLVLTGAGAAPPSLVAQRTPIATISACKIVDGDTIRCGRERIRLLGIDAPELPGHCRAGRVCAPGDPYESSASLGDALADTMTILRVGSDQYGRTLAMVRGPHGDLSCWQLRHRQAIYKLKWDNGGRVASLCPRAIA